MAKQLSKNPETCPKCTPALAETIPAAEFTASYCPFHKDRFNARNRRIAAAEKGGNEGMRGIREMMQDED